jgi:hypothetical protein
MNWLRHWMEVERDQFWRDWHTARYRKRLAHWESERSKHLQRAFRAGRMAQYYMDRICGVPLHGGEDK